uniref:Tectonic family member 3 n=1 Tax=Coturnix japonica TaxID=93934 RepID=A0A8C2SXW8_COTJA
SSGRVTGCVGSARIRTTLRPAAPLRRSDPARSRCSNERSLHPVTPLVFNKGKCNSARKYYSTDFCLGGSVCRSVNQVCVQKSLIFRANVPYRTATIAVSDGPDVFCVQLDNRKLTYFQQPKRLRGSDIQKLLQKFGRRSFSFSAQPHSRPASSAGDPILTYIDSLSVLSVLKQPVQLGVSGLCVDGNPAGFLESKSTSCARVLTDVIRSCTTDPALNAASYYQDLAVLKVPCFLLWLNNMEEISPIELPGTPYVTDNMCNNAVSEVMYEIEFNGTHGIQSVSVRFKVTSIAGSSVLSLQQRFTVRFWVSTRMLPHMLPRSGNPGYIAGAPLLIANSSMSVLRSEADGSCSQSLRHTVRFGSHMRTGCKLSNCSYIQLKLYEAFQGMDPAEHLARIRSARSTQEEEWVTILIQNCSVASLICNFSCLIPVTLDIQILWSKMGFLSNPQAQILGVRYFYRCQPLKVRDLKSFPYTHSVPLTTVVTFTELTEWPEPPRGLPKVHSKLPTDLFFPFKMALNIERTVKLLGMLWLYFLQVKLLGVVTVEVLQ